MYRYIGKDECEGSNRTVHTGGRLHEIPVIESVKVSENKATVKLTGAVENVEGLQSSCR